MNITLSADKRVLEAARAWATAHGTSVNSLIRDYLAGLVVEGNADTQAALFAKNAREGAGNSGGGADLSRRALYRGRRFGTSE